MKNYLLKKSVRDELEQRGITYRQYAAERSAQRTLARHDKAAEHQRDDDAPRQLQQEHPLLRQESGSATAHYDLTETGPATWLQLPAINIGAQVDVAGEQHYQDALEAVAADRNPFGVRRRLLTVTLVREPDNPIDPNAVRVEAAGAIAGHLSRDDAPRFHAIIDRLARADTSATCRAMLTGGWDRGGEDRGIIGMKIFTGRRPARWNGRAAFLSAVPWHEEHRVTLRRGGPGLSALPRKVVVTLVASQTETVEVSSDGALLGEIRRRPDIAAYIARVHAHGLPATANAQTTDGQLLVTATDSAAVMAALDALGSGNLASIRRRTRPTSRWICQRCGRIWTDTRRPPQRWYEIEDDDCGSPHICPGCWSYKFTHPL